MSMRCASAHFLMFKFIVWLFARSFNQTGTLARLWRIFEWFSFNLKAATDSLSVSVSMGVLLSCLVGCWTKPGHTFMCGPGFCSPDLMGKQMHAFLFCFTKDQPLVYYSSLGVLIDWGSLSPTRCQPTLGRAWTYDMGLFNIQVGLGFSVREPDPGRMRDSKNTFFFFFAERGS